MNIAGLVIGCIIGGVLLLLGGALVVGSLFMVWKGLRTRGWAATWGRVTFSEMITEERKTSSMGPSHRAKVVYEYEVQGKPFTSDSVLLVGTVSVRREQEIVNRYPVGRSVHVHYNPAKPEEALLEPGVTRSTFAAMGIGAGLFLVGLVLVLAFTGGLAFALHPLTAGLVFLVPGLLLILFGLRNIWVTAGSRHWPTTEGEVSYSGVVETTSSKVGSEFRPSVAYHYEVQGVAHTSTAIHSLWEPGGLSRHEAQQIADKYPLGKLVTVYYDPTKPHRAMLEPGGQWANYLVLLPLGAGFVIAGIAILVLGIR